MATRPKIPAATKMNVLLEAGYRCAIPTCRHPTTEIAHIEPYAKSKNNEFSNLIALCPNCHKRYDRDKNIPKSAIVVYKHNLQIINGRFSSHEKMILDSIIDETARLWNINKRKIGFTGFLIPNNELIYFHNLLVDEILKPRKLAYQSANGPIDTNPTLLELTEQGKIFVEAVISARKLK